MKRDCYQQLLRWKNSPHRKPLILRGARQVGKTYLLKQFGQQEFKNYCYVNLEEDPAVKTIFSQKLSPARILSDLAIYSNQPIKPRDTLIIIDEIQECPRALTSLKYFNEEAKEYSVIAAGSLLGVKLGKASGFPVGKVNFMDLYPLSFFEFLTAMDEEKLRNSLEKKSEFEPISEPVHLKLIELLRLYFFIGGMPEVIKQYLVEKDLLRAREVQQEILKAYLFDFSKHADAVNIMKISKIWHAMPNQLAKENKKFMYVEVDKQAKSREYETALHWLIDAGLVYQTFNVKAPRQPLLSYIDPKAFKLFLFDTGLLGCLSELSPQIILEGDQLFTEFKGALTENFVAQELKASGFPSLFYWASANTAEVDFLLPLQNKILPLEVKAGTSTKKKSLMVYANKYQPPVLLRTSLMNFKQDEKIANYPLYMVSCIPRLLQILS